MPPDLEPTPEQFRQAEANAAAMRAARARGESAHNGSRRKFAWVVLLIVIPLFGLPFAVFSPFFGLAKAAARFACPSDYERAYVKIWQESGGGTKTSNHWELRCVTPAGDVKGDDGTVIVVSSIVGFGMSMSALATLLVMRRKLRPVSDRT